MEKPSDTQVVDHDIQKGSSEHLEELPLTPDERRKLIWRIDCRLLLMLGFLHTVALIDRGNIGTAAVAGMIDELNLVGTQYSTIAVAFFPPYICCQVFGPLLVRKIGPVYYLSGVTFTWGAVMLSAGFVKHWTQLLGIRIIIGALEAGFFPASVYLISTWYTRFEMQKRFAVFFLLGCVASATTGILSYGITFMHGLGGLTAWRWIFVIQGLITCALGVISYFVLIDFPDKMKSSRRGRAFLTDDEFTFITERINRDRADVTVDRFSLRKYLAAGLDLHIWGFGLIYFCTTTTAYALAYFLSLIFQESMGFSVAASLCLFAPPYVAAGIVMFVTSWIGDRYRVRGLIVVFNAMLTLIGLPLMGFGKTTGAKLVGTFFTTMGANSGIPATMAYQANNVRGQWKRAICSAIFVGLGASGGMTGSLVYREEDSPRYTPGISTCIGLTVLIVVLVGLLSLRMHRRNRMADRGELVIEGLEGFRYTL
ncbi:MFS general substrate transporter [Aspergillus lucknowensis]|uniref:MFS general substrate transporter n=1 Tax=Aspergillus lucknowensis TaxID=176173 RepID=A0ABR4L602_9EURO